MVRQVLENGVVLPAEYSDDWYDDMTSNLTKLDDVIGSDSEKLSSADVGAAALSNNYNDLDNLPTIPTKTSDLTNDSNYVDTSNAAVASGITSSKVTDYDTHIADTDIHVTTADKNKWNNQTYVFRYSSTALVASSTNSNTLLDNTDNLKVGDKVIDSDGVLFSITAIDTANNTFTVGSALIDLALDANVVHTSGNETVAGNKNFKGIITTIPNETLWTATTNTTADITLLGRSALHIENKASGKLTDLSGGAWCVVELGEGCFFFRTNNGTDIRYKHFPTNLVNRIPVVSGANRFLNDVTPNQDNTYDLGSSSLRWATINGLNPSSLGMPDLSNGIDISGYINTGDSDNSYTPLADGYISVRVNSTNSCALYASQGDVYISSYGNIVDVDLGGFICSLFIPVVKNVACRIVCRRAQTIVSAKFYPCQGNV